MIAEINRLAEAEARQRYWKRWGPYLAERSWGTVREDYSADGQPWTYFTHDQARSRAYRWGEDGLLGLSDNHQRLCFSVALWNGHDPILKERLFGLTGYEGNHGEDVKEVYYYLDATPTHSYLKGLYKYPQLEFPYARLVAENARRGKLDPEFELQDTGAFDGDRYFDVFVEYAKNDDVDDIVIRIRVINRAREAADLIVLPTLWFRNTWTWCGPPYTDKPQMEMRGGGVVVATHPTLGAYQWTLPGSPELLFTENETNNQRLFGGVNQSPYVKDAFHEYLIHQRRDAVNPEHRGTKCCAIYPMTLAPEEETVLVLRLAPEKAAPLEAKAAASVFDRRAKEADEFYNHLAPQLTGEPAKVCRQAFAGLFWSKQFYHYVVHTWLTGDAGMPTPPPERKMGRNREWQHLFNEDVISMPDKWEFPWYAAWDLAFQAVAIAPADPDFAKSQLSLFLREWYMHPNGQLPAYEWTFSDVNPPLHSWACWRVYNIDERLKGKPDHAFLEAAFHKLLMNFTWWVNRKDSEGANIFEGGFLGLDNIGVFNRSDPLPSGWVLEQSDGTSWMACFCLSLLRIALELATINSAYEDIASKFFEHFLYIARAINRSRGSGLWDEEDGFYYDMLRFDGGQGQLLRLRTMVGLVPLISCDTLEERLIEQLPGFRKRMQWFIDHRPDLTGGLASMTKGGVEQRRLLSVVNLPRLKRILQRMFDESEFLSPYGVRSLSKYHESHPYVLPLGGSTIEIHYEPAESQSGTFGGNSNWRGPVWFPMNFLLVESLQRFHHYYGDSLQIEFPTGSGEHITLDEAADRLSARLCALFEPGPGGRRPVYNGNALFQDNPQFRDYVLFAEYFHADNGTGLGATHQTGWTGLVAKLLQQRSRRRAGR
jgi:hypothetical protein